MLVNHARTRSWLPAEPLSPGAGQAGRASATVPEKGNARAALAAGMLCPASTQGSPGFEGCAGGRWAPLETGAALEGTVQS